MNKSETDIHWNNRALNEKNIQLVNIADCSQRELETDFLLKNLDSTDNVLEVGCGNGFLTNILRSLVSHVDAFDFAENMIDQAKKIHGEKNNRFFHDNLLSPLNFKGPYDSIVCVRVLINLRNFEEQKIAIEHMKLALKPGGKLLLIEGYRDGFDALNVLRVKAGMEKLSPAKINFYCGLDEMNGYLEESFNIAAAFHTGSFDYLTRAVYPSLVGTSNASGFSDFHAQILSLAKSFNPDAFAELARLHGFLLIKK